MSYPLDCEEIIAYAHLEDLAEGTGPDAAQYFHFIILTGGKFNELITSHPNITQYITIHHFLA